MSNLVEFHLRANDSEDLILPLSNFFAPIAPTKINKSELVKKSLDPITIVLTIGAAAGFPSWLAGRYIFDPLANKLEEWGECLSHIWKTSHKDRGISITVQFQYPTDTFTISIGETSNPESLKPIWVVVKQMVEVYSEARSSGIQIDELRCIPDGTREMLIIGYTNKRPRYIIDLKTKSLKEIKNSEIEDRTEDVWKLSQIVRSYEYKKMLFEKGFPVSAEELERYEKEIEANKTDISE
jgi:hypothetical protein